MKKLILPLLFLLCSSSYAQTVSRLLATVNSNWTGSAFIPQDSARYRYSDDRIGDLTDQNGDLPGIKYDELLQWLYNSQQNTYEYNQRDTQTFYGTGRIVQRTKQYYQNGNWLDNNDNRYAYDTAGNLVSYAYLIYTGKWDTANHYLYSYDAAGNMTEKLTRWGFPLGNAELDSFTYNSNNNITCHTKFNYKNGAWENNWRSIYTYGANKELLLESRQWWNTTSNTWENDHDQVSVYNSNNLIASDTSKFWNQSSGSWVAGEARIYGYNGTQLTSLEHWSENGVWTEFSEEHYQYDNNGNMTEQLVLSYDPAFNDQKVTYTYNQFNQLTSMSNEENNGGWQYTFRRVHYYDVFNVSVPAVGDKMQLLVFPNPAGGHLHIRGCLTHETAVHAAICDMQGRLMMQWAEDTPASIDRTVRLSALPAGQYILTISGQTTKLSSPFSIVH